MVLHLTDFSATRPRMALALALSLLLHFSLLLRFDPPRPQAPASRAGLTVSLSDKTASVAAPATAGGVQSSARLPAEQVLASTGARSAPGQAADKPGVEQPETAVAAGGEALRKVAFFANASLVGEVPSGILAGVPALQDPAYLPVEKLAPRPQLPDGFEVAYPEAAKRERLRETVRVALLIDQGGRVVQAYGLNETAENAVLVRAAVQALSRTQFQPGQSAGRPEKSRVVIAVRFGYE